MSEIKKAARENGRLFLLVKSQFRVGLLGFGGPLASMAMMRDELVVKRRLLSESRYLEGLGVVKLLPGPVSTLLAVFLGQEVFGFLGGLLSVLCFVIPSFFLMLAISVLESRFLGDEISMGGFALVMGFLQASVLSIILWTCVKLFQDCLKREYSGKKEVPLVVIFAAVAALLALVHAPEILILLCCGLGGLGLQLLKTKASRLNSVGAAAIFWTFYKAGLTVFGTGYMVLPYLQRVLVDERHWLTMPLFLNGVAYGNLTPGPVVIASTYFGYQMGGLSGATAASLGIFLGPIMLMLILGPWLRRFLGRPWVEGILLGLLPAVAVTIALSLVPMAQAMQWDLVKAAVALIALIASMKKISGWKILLATLALGILSNH